MSLSPGWTGQAESGFSTMTTTTNFDSATDLN